MACYVDVFDFIAKNPSKLHHEDANGAKGTSQRSWTRLGTYLDNLKDTNTDIMTYYIKGTIGEALAAEFLLFYNNYVKTLTVDDIVKATKKKRSTDPQVIGKSLEKLIDPIESIQRLQLAVDLEPLIDTDDKLVYLSFLYALPVENLAGYLKDLNNERKDTFKLLVTYDNELTSKALFHRVITKQ
jgi:hypothetical protein